MCGQFDGVSIQLLCKKWALCYISISFVIDTLYKGGWEVRNNVTILLNLPGRIISLV